MWGADGVGAVLTEVQLRLAGDEVSYFRWMPGPSCAMGRLIYQYIRFKKKKGHQVKALTFPIGEHDIGRRHFPASVLVDVTDCRRGR